MQSTHNESIDVVHLEGPLLRLLAHADTWIDASGEIKLSDGSRYKYTLTKL